MQQPAFNPRVFDVHVRADAGAVIDPQQSRRTNRDGINHDVPPDPGTQGAQIERHPRRRRQQIQIGHFLKSAAKPPAEIGDTPQRIPARLQPAGDNPLSKDGNREVQRLGRSERRQGIGDRQRNAVPFIAREIVIDEERREPVGHVQHDEEGDDGALADPAERPPAGRNSDAWLACALCRLLSAARHRLGDGSQAPLPVNGLDAQGGIALV